MRNLKIFFVIIIALELIRCGGNSSKTEMPFPVPRFIISYLFNNGFLIKQDNAFEKRKTEGIV